MDRVFISSNDLPPGPFRKRDGTHINPIVAALETQTIYELQVLFKLPYKLLPLWRLQEAIVRNQRHLNSVEGKCGHLPWQWQHFFWRYRYHGETILDNYIRLRGARIDLPLGMPIPSEIPHRDAWGREMGERGIEPEPGDFALRRNARIVGGITVSRKVRAVDNRLGYNLDDGFGGGPYNQLGRGNGWPQKQRGNQDHQRLLSVFGLNEDPLPPLNTKVSGPLIIVDASDMPVHVFFLTDSNPDPQVANRERQAIAAATERRDAKGGDAFIVAKAVLTSNNPKINKLVDTKRGELFATNAGREDLIMVFREVSEHTDAKEGKWKLCGVGTSISEGRMYLLRTSTGR